MYWSLIIFNIGKVTTNVEIVNNLRWHKKKIVNTWIDNNW
jgi:hypothetical protein